MTSVGGLDAELLYATHRRSTKFLSTERAAFGSDGRAGDMKGTTEFCDLMLIIWNFELAIKELEEEVIEPALVNVQD